MHIADRLHIKVQRQKSIRRKLLLCLFFACLVVGFVNGQIVAYAKDDNDIEKQLSDTIEDQLKNLSLSDFEDFVNGLTSGEKEFFGSRSATDIIRDVVAGEFTDSYGNFFSALLNLLFRSILDFLPLIATVIALSILMGMFNNVKSKMLGKTTGEIVHIAGFSLIVIIVLTAIYQLISLTRSTVGSMQTQMNIIFPILLTIMTAIGGTASVKVYQPAVALLSTGLMEIILMVVLPLFILSLVFTVIGNLSENVKLDNFSSFLKTTQTYIIGFSFTIFMAFLSIQGITAASYDGVSIRTARFAVSKYVPIVGGYLSDGFSVIIAGSILIKNAVGLAGLVLLLATVVAPILQIMVFSLCIKLAASIIEPIGQERVSKFLLGISKNLSMLYVIIIAVAFMYFITVMLIVFTSNMAFMG